MRPQLDSPIASRPLTAPDTARCRRLARRGGMSPLTLALIAQFIMPSMALLGSGCDRPVPSEAQASERPKERGLSLDPQHPTRKFIKIETVQQSDGESALMLTGRVTFDEDHTQRVATPIDGRVQAIRVQIGDRVKKGQPLIELTSPQVGQIQAEAIKAQHDFEVASKAMERTRTLSKEGAVSDREVAQVDADFKKARADVGRMSAQLQALGINATDPAVRVEIRAQIGGIVVERNVLLGQEVRADQTLPLLTVTNLETVWILADVYEEDLALVKAGDPIIAHVAAYPGEQFPGKVETVAEAVDPASRAIKVRCVVRNPDLKLKAEMFAKLELKAAGAKSILVPPQAVLEDGERQQVIIVAGTNFSLREVQVGAQTHGLTRVLRGLEAGEQVVTDGALFLRREIEQH